MDMAMTMADKNGGVEMNGSGGWWLVAGRCDIRRKWLWLPLINICGFTCRLTIVTRHIHDLREEGAVAAAVDTNTESSVLWNRNIIIFALHLLNLITIFVFARNHNKQQHKNENRMVYSLWIDVRERELSILAGCFWIDEIQILT